MAEPASEADAPVVARLREAAADVFALSSLLEYAAGAPHPDLPEARNPVRPDRTAGGSSGGSAALVGAGVCRRRTRHRHRWLHPHPRRLLRCRRVQAELRPGRRHRRDPVVALPRPRRRARRQRGGLRAAAAGDRRHAGPRRPATGRYRPPAASASSRTSSPTRGSTPRSRRSPAPRSTGSPTAGFTRATPRRGPAGRDGGTLLEPILMVEAVAGARGRRWPRTRSTSASPTATALRGGRARRPGRAGVRAGPPRGPAARDRRALRGHRRTGGSGRPVRRPGVSPLRSTPRRARSRASSPAPTT